MFILIREITKGVVFWFFFFSRGGSNLRGEKNCWYSQAYKKKPQSPTRVYLQRRLRNIFVARHSDMSEGKEFAV